MGKNPGSKRKSSQSKEQEKYEYMRRDLRVESAGS